MVTLSANCQQKRVKGEKVRLVAGVDVVLSSADAVTMSPSRAPQQADGIASRRTTLCPSVSMKSRANSVWPVDRSLTSPHGLETFFWPVFVVRFLLEASAEFCAQAIGQRYHFPRAAKSSRPAAGTPRSHRQSALVTEHQCRRSKRSWMFLRTNNFNAGQSPVPFGDGLSKLTPCVPCYMNADIPAVSQQPNVMKNAGGQSPGRDALL